MVFANPEILLLVQQLRRSLLIESEIVVLTVPSCMTLYSTWGNVEPINEEQEVQKIPSGHLFTQHIISKCNSLSSSLCLLSDSSLKAQSLRLLRSDRPLNAYLILAHLRSDTLLYLIFLSSDYGILPHHIQAAAAVRRNAFISIFSTLMV